MLNETLRSMPDPVETLYAGSDIQLTKSGVARGVKIVTPFLRVVIAGC